MTKQIKSTLIQIIIGASVVVIGLVALNKFVPTFTLFPETVPLEEDALPKEDENQTGGANPAENTPADLPSNYEDNFSDEEEETAPEVIIPENVTANVVYSGNKRLKANNLGIYVPSQIFRNVKNTFTNYLHSEYCPEKVENYKKEVGIYFTLSRNDLVGSIFVVAVKTAKGVHYFKPQAGNNLLKIPNNFSKGRNEITYGYVLKNDLNKREVPFYSRKCSIVVE